MTDNNTSLSNSTKSSSPDIVTVFYPAVCVDLAVLILSVVTFIIGVTSWKLIKKFRHFRNYVFLTIILNNIVNIVMSFLFEYKSTSQSIVIQYIYGFLYLYFKLTVNYWLLVMCYMFYKDLVKVFNSDVKRKFLRSSLFAWGLPLIITIWVIVVMPHIESSGKVTIPIYMATLFLPLIINLLIYIRVLNSLLKKRVSAENQNRRDICQRFQISTIIFFISGTMFLLMPLRRILPYYLPIIFAHMQAVAMDIYLFVVKINREVWRNYYSRRIRKEFV